MGGKTLLLLFVVFPVDLAAHEVKTEVVRRDTA